ncbi:MAG: dTMP kinase [Acetobacterales bacterium]
MSPSAPGTGRFITVEGGDGAGKSTQVAALCRALRDAGVDVIATREPGGTGAAEEIRQLLVAGAAARWTPMTEALLHFAARREHLEGAIWPALAIGRWVVSDRFADSTTAYQGVGQGLGVDTVAAIYRVAVGDFAPDLTFILDLPAEEGLARAGARPGAGSDRYEGLPINVHRKLRQAFLDIAACEPDRCVLIDATADAERISARIRTEVAARFAIKLL